MDGGTTRYIEIDQDGSRFQLRVAAVFVRDRHVLLQHALDGPFWVLPGGRILPFESTADAIVRTMRDELGQDITALRPLWVMEYRTRIAGEPFHEIGFYYETGLPEGSPLEDLTIDHEGVERGHDLTLHWFAMDGLSDVPLEPAFFRTALHDLPDGIQHVVVDERGHGTAGSRKQP